MRDTVNGMAGAVWEETERRKVGLPLWRAVGAAEIASLGADVKDAIAALEASSDPVDAAQVEVSKQYGVMVTRLI